MCRWWWSLFYKAFIIDRVIREASNRQRPSISFQLNLSFCIFIGHDLSSPRIESQGHTLKWMVKVRVGVECRLTAAIVRFIVTSSAARSRGEACTVAQWRPAAAAESSACGRGNAIPDRGQIFHGLDFQCSLFSYNCRKNTGRARGARN